MICSNGHAFDGSPDGACPICGTMVGMHEGVQRVRITRAELKTLRDGLQAARILAKAAVRAWPESEVAQERIEAADKTLAHIVGRNGYAQHRRNRTKSTGGLTSNAPTP